MTGTSSVFKGIEGLTTGPQDLGEGLCAPYCVSPTLLPGAYEKV